jgi:hypothetical protein
MADDTLPLMKFGVVGVDIVSSPYASDSASLLAAQNVENIRIQGLGGLGSRGSLTPLNSVALAGQVLAFAPIPLPSPVDSATVDLMYRLTNEGLEYSPVPPATISWTLLLSWGVGQFPSLPSFAPFAFPTAVVGNAVIYPGTYDSGAGTTPLLSANVVTKTVGPFATLPGHVVDLASDGTNIYAAVDLSDTFTYADESPGNVSNVPTPLLTSRVYKIDGGLTVSQVGGDLTNATQTGDADPYLDGGGGPGATGSISGLAYGADGRLYVMVGGAQTSYTYLAANSALWSLYGPFAGEYVPGYTGLTNPASQPPPVQPDPPFNSGPTPYGAASEGSVVMSINPATDPSWTYSGANLTTNGSGVAETPAAGLAPAWDSGSSEDGFNVWFGGLLTPSTGGPVQSAALPNYSQLDTDTNPATWPATGSGRKTLAFPGSNAGTATLIRVGIDPSDPTDAEQNITLQVSGENAGVAWFGQGIFFNGSFFVPFVTGSTLTGTPSAAKMYRLDADDTSSPATGWTIDKDLITTFGAALPGKPYLAGAGANQKLFLPMVAPGDNGYLLSRDQSGTWDVVDSGLDLVGAGFPLTVPV